MADWNDRITVSLEDGVADVRLARPERMNALDRRMFAAIAAVGAHLASLSGLRCVVLSGAGRAFCAGLDRDELAQMAAGQVPFEEALAARTHGDVNFAQHAVMLWRRLPVPVVAAVHGVAFGGGFQLMLGADIRVMAPDTRLCVMEVRYGLIPDMAGIALMRRLAGDDVVRELVFTAREFDGEEARTLGLATRLAGDPHAEAMRLAHAVAASSPHAVRAAKRLLDLAAAAADREILLAESVEQDRLVASPNQIEAVAASLGRRPPRFVDV